MRVHSNYNIKQKLSHERCHIKNRFQVIYHTLKYDDILNTIFLSSVCNASKQRDVRLRVANEDDNRDFVHVKFNGQNPPKIDYCWHAMMYVDVTYVSGFQEHLILCNIFYFNDLVLTMKWARFLLKDQSYIHIFSKFFERYVFVWLVFVGF